ncbi:MAG: caspase family protein [Myxococcota bacterium]
MIAWLLFAGCPKPPVQVDKGLTPARSTLEALREARAPRREAVLVGVDGYDDPTFPPLRHAGDDARDLGARLAAAEVGGFDRVTVLTGADTSRVRILEALRELRDALRHDDVLVVYFSGHGTRARDAVGAWHRFLVPRDGLAGDLAGTALDLRDLEAYFSTLAPARKALVVDACFDGDGRSVVAPDAGDAPADSLVPGASGLGPGEAYLFATSSGRPAREDDALGHGVYTAFWLDALGWGFGDADVDRDHVLTAWEIHDYARGRVMAHTGGVQVPEAAFRVVGEGDLVVAGDPDPRKRADRALIYLYPDEGTDYADAAVLVDGRQKGALPGTVPVAPGRHHVLVTSDDGTALVDGWLRLSGGRAYPVDEVARLAQGPGGGLGVRAAFVGSAPLRQALGPGAVGTELYAVDRANGEAGRGFVTDGALGAALSPGGAGTRPLGWATGSLGWQGDLARLRLRLGLGLTFAWVPPRFDERPVAPVDPREHPTEAGWWFLAGGPSLGAGVVVGDGWTALATVRPHVAWLDPDDDGRPQAVPFTVASVGIEVDR